MTRLIPPYFSVKSVSRKIPGVDPILGPEMKSTGIMGMTFDEAFAKRCCRRSVRAWGVLLSLFAMQIRLGAVLARSLIELG